MDENTKPGQEKIDRYPGARPFTDNELDSQLFFGRETETHQLLHQILASRMLVVSGKSGLGKTSLLQAGVFPRLRDKDYLPLTIRLNQTQVTPEQLFTQSIQESCEQAGVDYIAGDESGVWELFKTASFWRGDRLQTPLLFIDQFEELFTLWQGKSRHKLIELLAELINPYIPERVQNTRRAQDSRAYKEQPLSLKLVLCLREDYVGELQSLVGPIPGILENRFRLTAMNRSQAEQAVIRPAALTEHHYSSPCFKYKQAGLDELLGFLSGIEAEIEPFQLQILCQQIETKVRQANNANQEISIGKGFLGGQQAMQGIIADFYLQAIKSLKQWRKRSRARRLCEEGLLSVDGKRLSMEEAEIKRRYKVGAEDLQQLVHSRLLRKEPRLNSYYYELSHDSLTVPVQSKKRWRMPLFVKMFLFMLIFAGFLGFWKLDQAQQAEKQAEAARSAAEELINFMIFELSEQLEPVGRLDIVESMQQQVANYYQRFGSSGKATNLRRQAAFLSKNGDRLYAQGNLKGAEEEYRKSLDIVVDLSTRDPSNSDWQRDLSVNYINIGDILHSQGDLKGAEGKYRKSLEIRDSLSKKDPSNSGWQRDLSVSYNKVGDILKSQDDLKGAAGKYRKSHEIAIGLSTRDPSNSDWQRDLSVSYIKIGGILQSQGDLKGAEGKYRKLFEIIAGLSKKDPSNSGWQRDLSVSYNKVGDVLRSRGDLKGAEGEYRKSLKIAVGLSKRDPSHSGWQRDLSVSYNKVGDILQSQGDLKGAEGEYRKSLEIRDGLSKRDPSHSGWQRDLSVSYDNVGNILRSQGDLKGAEGEYRKSLEIAVGLSKRDPSNSGWQRDLSVGYNKVGDILQSQGNLKGAEGEYRKSLEIFVGLSKRDPSNSGWQQDVVVSLYKLANIYKHQSTDTLPLQKKYLEKALMLLKSLNKQGRLPKGRLPWIGVIEQELAAINKTK